MFALLLDLEDVVESVPLRRGSNPAGDAAVPDATRHPHAALERTALSLLCGGQPRQAGRQTRSDTL